MKQKFMYQGAMKYPEIGIITDKDVLTLIKKHSRLIDRLQQSKMVEMSICGQLIIAKVYNDIVDPEDSSWMFYGADGFFDRLYK